MKIGIMQPYFFPYLGYFDLINRTDLWIVFDTAQYIRHGWINRNRILHPTTGWQYVIAPLKKHDRFAEIREIEVVEEPSWGTRILGQLEHYRRSAPHFEMVRALVHECLSNHERSISRLNTSILSMTCQILGISFNYRIFSEMSLSLGPVEGPGDWALRIAEALGAEEYVNPPGGIEIFDPSKFSRSNIRLTFRELPSLRYVTRGYGFEPDLSIVDLLMWNEPARIKEHLDLHLHSADVAA